MTDDDFSTLDLDAYLQRIGFQEKPTRSAESLEQLHAAHATSIHFENLDILLGRPIRIDLPSIQAKLIQARRGGYCFEHNRLFAAMLDRIGFRSTYLAARVRYRVQRVLPRTHLLLRVDVGGRDWIADVGFGTIGLLMPIPQVADQVFTQCGWDYRLVREESHWVLQTRQEDGWQSLYVFSLESQLLPDIQMANHYVSTHPDSRFVQTLITQRSTREARYLLRNYELIIDRGGQSTTTAIGSDDELLQVLNERFELHFPEGTRFLANRAPSGAG